MDAARVILGDQPVYCAGAEDCLRQSDVAVIAVPWKEYAHGPEKAPGRRVRRLVLIDQWRIAPESLHRKTKYVPVGVFSAPGKK
jgi:hypothetical protein